MKVEFLIMDLFDSDKNLEYSEIENKNREIIFEVLNDWPSNFKSIEYFIFQIKKYLKSEKITEDNIDKINRNILISENLWQVQAIEGIKYFLRTNCLSELTANNLHLSCGMKPSNL